MPQLVRSLPLRCPSRGAALAALLFLSVRASAGAPFQTVGKQDWPSFRGPNARGWLEGHATAATWDVEKGLGVRWKAPIPGLGLSSPIVWGKRVFVTTAVSESDDAQLKVGLYGDIASARDDARHRWQVICLDRARGEVLWQVTAREGKPAIRRHPKSSHASSTPATDGERVVAFFGSEGLYAYDLEGTLLWEKDLGRLHSGFYVVPQAQWGFGSSPVIHAGLVLVQCDVQEGSFIAAFGAADGREVWRTRRDEVPTWSTPAIYLCDTNEDRSAQVIANGYRHIGGYDLHTGKALWRLRGGGDIPVPTPVVWEDLVFITNAHGSLAPIYAVRAAGAQGEIELGDGDWSHTHLAWSEKRGGNYMQTPIVYRDWLYLCKDNGVVSCYEPRTGKLVFRERLGTGKSGFTASPVAADGKLYFTSEDGDVYVLAAGVDKLEVRATNKLGEVAMATPAISRGELFFRTRRHVVCIVEPAKESAEAAEPRRD